MRSPPQEAVTSRASAATPQGQFRDSPSPNSVGIFAVGSDGELTYVEEEWTRGNYPRSFNFDPTGRFFYCCNQRADNVTVFRANRDTGALTFTGLYTPVGNPSSIIFLDLATGD